MTGREPGVRRTGIEGVLVIEPVAVRDHRGFFVRTLSADVLAAVGLDAGRLVEENQSRSRRATLRGLHGRKELAETKLVRCARGRVFEVVVDLRPWSVSFGRYETLLLDDHDHRQVLVPPGCVHGFQAMTEEVDVCYRHDERYRPALDLTLAWDDPELAIPWPLPDPVLSERDRDAPTLAQLRPSLSAWFGPGRG